MIVETHDLQPVASDRQPRWAVPVIALVVALTLAIGGVVGYFLVNGRGAGMGPLAAWAPADAAIYAEVDLSLPGAQRANVAALLDHWSAVNPDLILGDEFAGWVDDLIGTSGAPISYAEDVAPWLSGTFAMVMTEWPTAPAGSAMMTTAIPEGALIIGSRDDAAAADFADRMRAMAEEDAGATFTSSDHGGVTVWSLEIDASASEYVDNAEFAYAVTDGAILLASGADQVQRMLDTHGGGASLTTNADVARLASALPAERIGLAVMDTRGSLDQVLDILAGSEPDLAATLETYAAGLPPITVASLSVEADRVVMTSAASTTEGVLAMKPLSEALAERIPAGALFFASAADIGTSLSMGIDVFIASMSADELSGPMVEEWIAEFESATGVAVADLFSWADDLAVYADWNGTEPIGGVIALTDDPAAAADQIDRLVDALAETAGSSVIVERDGDVTRLSTAGGPIVEIAVGERAVTVAVGSGEAARLAGVDRADSLAADGRYAGALSAVGGSATDAAVWLDLAGIVDAVAAAMPDTDPLSPQRLVMANFEPLDHLIAATRVEGDITISRMDLVVR